MAVNGSRRKKPESMVLMFSPVVIILPVKPVSGGRLYAAALATGSVALLPGSAQAMWLLGAGTNAGMQYADSGEINSVNSVAAGWINAITMGQGWKGTIA